MSPKQLSAWSGPQFSTLYKDWEIPFLSMKSLPIVLALTGPTKTGKTIIAKRLVTEYDFHYESMSSILVESAKKLGKEVNDWQQLGQIAMLMRQQDGEDILAKLVIERINMAFSIYDKVVVDSVLHPAEIRTFSERTNFKLVGIIADRELRVREYLRWYGGSRGSANRALRTRDEYEQFGTMGNNKIAPNVDACLNHSPIHMIEIHDSFNSETVLKPIDLFLEEELFIIRERHKINFGKRKK
jgi:cytidylate kinase